ncbi:MAG: hypothetical protein M3317_04780 [Actinomycetota bacterium]|nr:hypothetical protein [Actinomycetota bacterium]
MGEVTEDFDTAVRSILTQLLEAREDQKGADKQLHDYKAAKTPPEVPDKFEDVIAFLDYHHRRQSYENLLKQRESDLKKARKEYEDAADELLLFLPDGVPLRYAYEGEKSELSGTEYIIVRKQDEIVIERSSGATT